MKIGKILKSFIFNKKLFEIVDWHEDSLEPSIFAYALILTYHPTLSKELSKIRQDLEIKLIPYDRSDPNFFTNIRKKVDEKTFTKMLTLMRNFLQKYKISEEWSMFISMKILTDILPIPFAYEPISFHFPPSYATTQDDIEWWQAGISIYYRNNYPSIVLSEDVKIDNVYQYLKEHWKPEIEPVLKNLPRKKLQKIDINRFALGVKIYIWKDLERHSWGEIDEIINALIDKTPSYFGKDYVPTRMECAKILDETKAYFNQIYPL
ncbi:MAG TPA: hypothetical protein VMR77_04270 [Patescibacteria group bacterium]|nr:hypothetical protein [Patescibacteria group bacterium]